MSIMKELITKPLTATLSLLLLSSVALADKPEKASLGTRSMGEGSLFTCEFPLPAKADLNGNLPSLVSVLPAPLEDTFLLHSNPGATQILYIDFNGHDGVWGDYTPFNMDADPLTFTAEERTVIQEAWLYVAEDFLPFNIDVTTEEPPEGWLGQRAVVDGSHQYTYSWAYIGDWASTADREAYVYPGPNTWDWIGHSISHEVGHSLDLHHHGSIDDGGYYQGHGVGATQWAPIMGWGAWSLTNWSHGTYFEATNPDQDDLAVITNVLGVDYRVDDHGDTIGSATPITISTTSEELSAEGIISETDDVDYFAFSTTGGNIQFSINKDIVLGQTNLDVLAQIHDASGAVIHSENQLDLINATFSISLLPGDYYISIDGIGWGDPLADPPVGYIDYGILGRYSIHTSAGDPISAMVSQVSQSFYETYHFDIESSGLGLYDATKNQGFRNRDFVTGSMTGSLGNQEAQKYIEDQFTNMGLTVSVQGPYKNVVGELTGTKTPEKVYIIGGHFDHISGDSPGGDDNASGTAGVLEAARVLSQYYFESTIRFICFNAEEDGLKGSADYVANIPQEENIIGMINMDMILRPGSDTVPSRPIDLDIETYGSFLWAVKYMLAASDYVPSVIFGDLWDIDESWSDNDSFQEAGIPSFLVIENSYGDWYPPNPIANTYYHDYEDASDRLANDPDSPSGVTYDYPFATDVVRIGVALLAKEAIVSDPPIIWVDFDFQGLTLGTYDNPYALLQSGVSAQDNSIPIYIASGTSNETLTISKPMTLNAYSGLVRIGE